MKTYLDGEADKMAKAWRDEYRVPIKSLSDERQDTYRQIKGWSTDPEDIDLARPASWMEPTSACEADGSERPLPTYEHHLLCDEDGDVPREMNEWESEVLQAEMQRQGFRAWYRNPSRPARIPLALLTPITIGSRLSGLTSSFSQPNRTALSQRISWTHTERTSATHCQNFRV